MLTVHSGPHPWPSNSRLAFVGQESVQLEAQHPVCRRSRNPPLEPSELADAVSRAHGDSRVSAGGIEGNHRDHRLELPGIADRRDETICPRVPGTWRASGQEGLCRERAKKSGAGSAHSARKPGLEHPSCAEPLCPHQQKGDNSGTYHLGWLGRLNELVFVTPLE